MQIGNTTHKGTKLEKRHAVLSYGLLPYSCNSLAVYLNLFVMFFYLELCKEEPEFRKVIGLKADFDSKYGINLSFQIWSWSIDFEVNGYPDSVDRPMNLINAFHQLLREYKEQQEKNHDSTSADNMPF